MKDVFSIKIEECILNSGYAIDWTVMGIMIDDEEIIVCWIKLCENNCRFLAKINRIIDKEIGGVYKVDYFVEMSDIPKNNNGKLDKKKMLKDYWKWQYKLIIYHMLALKMILKIC